MSKNPENNDQNEQPNNFGLPDGYFDRSAASIVNKIEWVEEHKEFKHLSSLKKETGFSVPENYFDKLEEDLELMAYPNLLSRKKDPGFSVPQNYFEEAEVNELGKVLLTAENEISSLDKLNAIKKENSFSVDENYFSDSEKRIISALNNEAKVINLFKPKVMFSAVAAVLTLVLGLWIYNQYFKTVTSKDCGSLACLDKKDLLKGKSLESLDNDELYELVNTKKLEEKLDKKSEKRSGTQNTDTSLKNVSTDELLDEI